MRSKKIQSKHMRKHRNKKSNKSKKCGCGLKIPFLKWGGDNPNDPTNNTDLSGKFNSLLTNINEAYNNTADKINNDFKDLKYSTQDVIDHTSNHIKTTSKGIVDDAQKNTADLTSKTNGFFTNVYKNAKNTLDKVTNKADSFPSAPKKVIPTSSSLSSSSSSKNSSNKPTSSISSSSNKSKQSNSTKYTDVIKKRRYLLNSNGNSANSNNKQGGKRRSSKRQGSRKNVKSKKTKRRRHIYKHKGGSGYMDGPLGIEKSSLAFTASPISNINAVGPRPDQMYGQNPYPAWRFSE